MTRRTGLRSYSDVLGIVKESYMFTAPCLNTEPNNLRNFQTLQSTIPSCSQFHQRFTYKFFVRTLFRQLFSSYMYVEKAAKTTFVQKICT